MTHIDQATQSNQSSKNNKKVIFSSDRWKHTVQLGGQRKVRILEGISMEPDESKRKAGNHYQYGESLYSQACAILELNPLPSIVTFALTGELHEENEVAFTYEGEGTLDKILKRKCKPSLLSAHWKEQHEKTISGILGKKNITVEIVDLFEYFNSEQFQEELQRIYAFYQEDSDFKQLVDNASMGRLKRTLDREFDQINAKLNAVHKILENKNSSHLTFDDKSKIEAFLITYAGAREKIPLLNTTAIESQINTVNNSLLQKSPIEWINIEKSIKLLENELITRPLNFSKSYLLKEATTVFWFQRMGSDEYYAINIYKDQENPVWAYAAKHFNCQLSFFPFKFTAANISKKEKKCKTVASSSTSPIQATETKLTDNLFQFLSGTLKLITPADNHKEIKDLVLGYFFSKVNTLPKEKQEQYVKQLIALSNNDIGLQADIIFAAMSASSKLDQGNLIDRSGTQSPSLQVFSYSPQSTQETSVDSNMQSLSPRTIAKPSSHRFDFSKLIQKFKSNPPSLQTNNPGSFR